MDSQGLPYRNILDRMNQNAWLCFGCCADGWTHRCMYSCNPGQIYHHKRLTEVVDAGTRCNNGPGVSPRRESAVSTDYRTSRRVAADARWSSQSMVAGISGVSPSPGDGGVTIQQGRDRETSGVITTLAVRPVVLRLRRRRWFMAWLPEYISLHQ